MRLPGDVAAAHLVAAAATARLVAHSHQDLGLHACSVHGRHIVSAECSERLSALAVSPDGRFLLTGGAKGAITLRWLHSLQVGCQCLVLCDRCIMAHQRCLVAYID